MSLTSVAAPIWNEIAKTQELKTAWARMAFSLDPAKMAELEDQEFGKLKAKHGAAIASAFLDLKPLLLERKAISAHLRKHPELNQALPEVNSISEAVALASMDRPLSRTEQKQLTALLQAIPH